MPSILEGYCSKSSKPRKEAEEEAKAFLQIIEDSASYQFGFNHSTGYSMIGYTCAYLRYYYPEEFIAAYLNNANNEDDIRFGTELANTKNITIHPIKFRHSGAAYTVDKANHCLYKGVSSIKFLNAEVADSLYSMRNNTFDSFVSLLDVFPGNSKQLEILIRLGYFSEFGGSLKLIKTCELYQRYKGKKQIKKDSNQLPIEIVHKYASIETEKIFKFEEQSMTTMLKELINLIPDQDLPLRACLEAEQEYLGYISYKDPSKAGQCIVMALNTKYSTLKITLY